jgi:hypothetical protein
VPVVDAELVGSVEPQRAVVHYHVFLEFLPLRVLVDLHARFALKEAGVEGGVQAIGMPVLVAHSC